METIVQRITGDNTADNEIFTQAAEILKKGGLVAFPTETVYGLGANALDADASSKIYAAKGRPSDNPLIVHIADMDALEVLAKDVPDIAYRLAERFWPGPMTMILNKKDLVPNSITGGLGTVAIRMPNHKTAQKLIKMSGIYIAAPSANTSGKPSPTRAEHVYSDLNGRIDMIIEDDTVDIGLESTIIDLSEEIPTILRPGFITEKMFLEVIDSVRLDPGIMEGVGSEVIPKAPGMKYRHYAPNAHITIVEGQPESVVEYINSNIQTDEAAGIKAAVMTTEEMAKRYICRNVVSLGSSQDELSMAKNLYAVLRDFDRNHVERVYSESFNTENVGRAVMNRLVKAAGHKIIHVD